MNDRMIELQQGASDAAVFKAAVGYQGISPRIDFGSGGRQLGERLLGYEERHPDFDRTNASDLLVSGGWIALETAAHFPPGVNRLKFLGRSIDRFTRVADSTEAHSSSDLRSKYYAKLGLIAANAYTDSLDNVLEDTPGMYSAVLEEMLLDKEFEAVDRLTRRGLISEVTVATLASDAGYLTLPASSRHDQPSSIERPCSAHDLQLWTKTPSSLPARPDRKIQVKTRSSRSDVKYASNITLVRVSDDFNLNHTDHLARQLVKHYNGGNLSAAAERHLQRCKTVLRSIIETTVEAPDDYTFMPSRMRGSGNNRTGSLTVFPRSAQK